MDRCPAEELLHGASGVQLDRAADS